MDITGRNSATGDVSERIPIPAEVPKQVDLTTKVVVRDAGAAQVESAPVKLTVSPRPDVERPNSVPAQATSSEALPSWGRLLTQRGSGSARDPIKRVPSRCTRASRPASDGLVKADPAIGTSSVEPLPSSDAQPSGGTNW